MAASVRVVDEHFGASAPVRRSACELRLASERVTPREIIRRRVESEVEDVNRAKAAHLEGHARTRSFLISLEAGSPEARLNGVLSSKHKPKLCDVEHEAQRALDAFQNRSFIMKASAAATTSRATRSPRLRFFNIKTLPPLGSDTSA